MRAPYLPTRRRESAPDAVGNTARSLPIQVAERLMNEIIDGKLAPGAPLREIALSEQHAVSRATIREALAHLEKHHFVERAPRIGARVTAIDLDEITELYELRAVLLGLAARRAASHGDADGIERFDTAVSGLETLANRAGTSSTVYTTRVLETQELLIEAARSRWLANMYDMIANQSLWRVLVREKGAAFATPQRRLESAADWRSLADALLARDSNKSEIIGRRLIDASAQFVLQNQKGR